MSCMLPPVDDFRNRLVIWQSRQKIFCSL